MFTATVAIPFPIVNPLGVTPATLPAGMQGIPYGPNGDGTGVQFSGQGGTAPYTFSVPNGQSLPAGLTLSAAGMLSGTPTTVGNNVPVPVTCTDADGTPVTVTLQLNVLAPLVIISPTIPPEEQIGQPVSLQFGGEGGTPPYAFSASGVPGLSMSSSGLLTGTVAGPTGTDSLVVTMTDSSV